MEMNSFICKDPEVEWIDHLADSLVPMESCAKRIDVANLYVTLKHRPVLILVGSEGSAMAALVESIARIFSADGELQGQLAPGHAWYAGESLTNTFLVGLHTRLITEKLLSAMEEALQPANMQRVFVVGLTHISPAELLSIFDEAAFQVPHERIMRIGDTHLPAPIPFPPNLLLIGTMDTTCFHSYGENLLSGATVIEWPGWTSMWNLESNGISQNLGSMFLRGRIHDSQKALEKLHCIAGFLKHPLQAILSVRNVIQAHGREFPPAWLNEAIIYLANAWSRLGNGLFDPCTDRNLAISSDFAVAQLVLPRILDTLGRSTRLQKEMCSVMEGCYPRSEAFLKRHCEAHDH